MEVKKFNKFNNEYTNKFDFVLGKSYEYDDLPKKVKNDIDAQFGDGYNEYGPTDYNYICKLITPEDNSEYLESAFGEWDIENAIDHPYMKRLVKKIKENGLDYPAVGTEGNHRALAYYIMEKPLPYLEMILKDEDDEDDE